LNVPLRSRQRGMAGEFLHVSRRAAGLNDALGAPGDERAALWLDAPWKPSPSYRR
jgi:hypothetical protein